MCVRQGRRKEQVVVMREEEGKRYIGRADL